MNILDQLEINGALVLVMDIVPELGMLIKIGDLNYKVIDTDRFDCDVNHMIVVERV